MTPGEAGREKPDRMMEPPRRLVLGVTGHRRLELEKKVAAAVDAVLDEIVRRAAGERAAGQHGAGEDAPPLKLSVLSPLAEGADRLVAKRVLAREGGELEAVLPMDEREYEADFATDASRAEFRSLLARACTIHRLPPVPKREEAYAAAGRYVVDRCDILIAVWDGAPEEGRGGTAEIVRYARARARRLVIIGP